jgi:hypothetical protein
MLKKSGAILHFNSKVYRVRRKIPFTYDYDRLNKCVRIEVRLKDRYIMVTKGRTLSSCLYKIENNLIYLYRNKKYLRNVLSLYMED